MDSAICDVSGGALGKRLYDGSPAAPRCLSSATRPSSHSRRVTASFLIATTSTLFIGPDEYWGSFQRLTRPLEDVEQPASKTAANMAAAAGAVRWAHEAMDVNTRTSLPRSHSPGANTIGPALQFPGGVARPFAVRWVISPTAADRQDDA